MPDRDLGRPKYSGSRHWFAVRSQVGDEKLTKFGLFWKDCGEGSTEKPLQQRVKAILAN
ncbi:hypothetical protein ACLLDM_000890 [Enterobacter hormaechei]